MATNANGQTVGVTDEMRERDAQRRLQDSQPDYSILSWLNPFSYSFGGLIMFGLVAFGVYFFGFSDKGKKLLGDLFDGLSPEWQDTLMGWGEKFGLVPEGAKDLADVGRKHGVELGDVMSGKVDVFEMPDLMYDAMLEAPDAVLNLAQQNAKKKPDEQTTAKAMAAVRSIVSDPAKLATLLDSKNKANTYALLEALSPIPVQAGALGTFIDKVGLDKDGKPTAELSALLLAVLDEKADATSRSAALKKFGQRNPAALADLLAGIDTSAIADDKMKADLEAAKAVPKESLDSAMKLEERLTERGTSIGAVVKMADSPESLVKFMLDDTQRGNLFNGNTGLIAQTIAGYEKELAAKLPGIKDPAKRDEAETTLNFYRFLNTGEKGKAVNIEAIHELFRAVDGSAYSKANPKRTENVLVGMFGMLTGDEAAAKKMHAAEVAQFFADPTNAQAFTRFFNKINPNRLSNGKGENLRGFVAALKKHWGDRTHGLADVFDDQQSITKILELVQNPPQAWTSFPGDWGIPNMVNKAGEWVFWNVSGATKDMADNRDSIEAISTALRDAGVSSNGAAKPAKRATGNATAIH